MIFLELSIPVLLILACIYLILEYSLLVPAVKGLPVLMYHNISKEKSDGLNIPVSKLELQLMYLKEKGYRTVTLKEISELIRNGAKLPGKAVLLTFDDAYSGIEKELIPFLERYGFNAVVFVPVAYMGKSNLWDDGNLSIIDAGSLKKITGSGHIEIGLHSFLHKSYNDLLPEDMEEDLKNCRQTLDFYNIPYCDAFAYPYGAYPRKDEKMKQEMFAVFRKSGIEMAFRIGNRINKFPLRERYELTRTDIRGSDSFFVFRTKLKKGRAKVFA